MDEWQPIDYAPQGDIIIGFVNGEVRLIKFGKTSHVPIFGWCLADQGGEAFDICSPTHWMPLPEKPNGV